MAEYRSSVWHHEAIWRQTELFCDEEVSVNPLSGLREQRNHAIILQSPNRLQWIAAESVRGNGENWSF